MADGSHNAHILVVDDNEMNRDILSRTLQRAGYRVQAVEDGRLGLEALDEEDFDLVLLDIMMPGISGLEALEQIRERWDITQLPVVMVTAKDGSKVIADAFERGANDYVTKPLEMREVQARVRTHLAVRDESRSSDRGDFHELNGLDEPLVPSDQDPAYCPKCQSVVQKTSETCSFCEAAPPPAGWPEIADADFPFLGQTIAGRFYLRRLIGRGHIGSVYQARDLDLSRAYAVKIVDLDDTQNESIDTDTLRDRTRREAEILSRLSNPHVAKIHEVRQVKPSVFGMVMDYVEGQTLETLVDREGSLDPLQALAIARQIAQGLYEAHQQGVVHCDLKPANFMIEQLPVRGEFVYILDFGISQFLQNNQRGQDYYTGTPEFSAPEQIAPEGKVDARTDVYGLGGVLYQMVTGEVPFAGEDVSTVLQAHLHQPAPSIMQRVSAGRGYELLDQIIQSMMAKDPKDRLQSMSEFIDCVDTIRPVIEREQ